MDAEQRSMINNNSMTLAGIVSIEILKPLLLQFKIFTSAMVKDLKTEHDLFQELPTRGPDAFKSFLEVLKKANYERALDVLKGSQELLKKSEEEVCYISSKSRGYCLIINNVEFKSLEYRHGSDRDADALEKFFKNIGYSVDKESNKTAKEMSDILVTFSKRDFTNFDLCIIIILSHGNNINNLDIIFGTDDKYVYKRDILSLFSNERESLLHKPKIFFFQSCRGNMRDYGVPSKLSEMERIKVCKRTSSESYDASGFGLGLPIYSDVFVIHSTLPYHISHRDHNNGTWFCQDLLSVLEKYYCEEDFDSMMRKVSQKLMERLSSEHRTKQALHIETFGPTKCIRFA